MDCVGYIRVSTERQGRSGLGLEAQQAVIVSYCVGHNLIHVYVEIETGKNSARPEIARALAHAKRIGARLVIAKLDRLARKVHFISGLMEAGVDFIALDMPHATPFTLHIMAAVAEHEGKAISERTKAALSAAKARGVLLGSARPGHWKGREHLRAATLARGRATIARNRAAKSGPVPPSGMDLIRQLKERGVV